jgi:hypothetical protein
MPSIACGERFENKILSVGHRRFEIPNMDSGRVARKTKAEREIAGTRLILLAGSGSG